MTVTSELSIAVGKLILGKVVGDTLTDETQELLCDGVMSGVTLFKENAVNLRQLMGLVEAVNEAAGESSLITVDQEGGAVQRFDEVLSPLPSAMALGSLSNPEMIRTIIEVSGEQLRLLGIQCVLAPVLDLASNRINPIISTRAFSDDSRLVSNLGTLVAQTYKKFGILPVGKHFPGHGDTNEDSHLQLAVTKADRETLLARELVPFASCLPTLPAVLVGHLHVSALDSDPLPASLSRTITTELLREKMGYQGVVMTDDLPGMRAIMDNFGLEDACIKAVNAGADLLLVAGSNEQIKSSHNALVKAVQNGRISEDRLQESLQRRHELVNFFRGRFDVHKKIDVTARLERLHQ